MDEFIKYLDGEGEGLAKLIKNINSKAEPSLAEVEQVTAAVICSVLTNQNLKLAQALKAEFDSLKAPTL